MRSSRRFLAAALHATVAAAGLIGCANPGPPRPPSLQIPAPIHDLSATRRGASVTLQFTLPQRTSDGVTLRSGTMQARLCRAVGNGACVPVPTQPGSFPVPNAPKTPGLLRDELPPDLANGPSRLLTYRLLLANPQGKDAGFSDAAFAAGGSPPPQVTQLRAQGSALGVVLEWTPTSDDSQVLLQRNTVSQPPGASPMRPASGAKDKQTGNPKSLFGARKAQPANVVLDAGADTDAHSPASRPGMILDATAEPGTYRYSAERRRTVKIGSHSLEMWSGLSTTSPSSIVFTLKDSFPPPVPKDLNVAGFTERDSQGTRFAVDLIWEPVEDEHLAGYKVYRDEIVSGEDDHGAVPSQTSVLTPELLRVPGFHDTTAKSSKRYRYRVTSVDSNGNESEPALAILEPQAD